MTMAGDAQDLKEDKFPILLISRKEDTERKGGLELTAGAEEVIKLKTRKNEEQCFKVNAHSIGYAFTSKWNRK